MLARDSQVEVAVVVKISPREVSVVRAAEGVTGSGKTEIYIEAVRQCLSQKRTAIILLPEISLTPQIAGRFRAVFGDTIALFH